MAGTTRACLFSVSKCAHVFNRVHFRTSTASFGFPGFKIADKLHSRQLAQDFIFRLNHKERAILLDELQRFQAQAAAIKEDAKPEPPTKAQLKTLLAHSAVPFIGFGFLDNLIMIVAGDYIDATIGITLGISTMAAAGLGNTLSDVAGIGGYHHTSMSTGMRLQMVWPCEGSRKDSTHGGCLTFSEIASWVKQDISSSYRQAPIHEWFEGNRPSDALLGTSSMQDESTLARLGNGHTEAQQYVAGFKVYPPCLNCNVIQAAPAHILYWLP